MDAYIAGGVVIAFLIGFGAGYALGWNRALHPDKVAAQLAKAKATVQTLEQKIKDKL